MSSVTSPSIQIGTWLSGPGAVASCTVAGFVRDTKDIGDGPVFALTVWHAFARENSADVHIEKSPNRVGSLMPAAARELSRVPFWTAIGLVKLDGRVARVDATYGNDFAPLIAAPMDAVLGGRVCRFGITNTDGIVTATHGVLRLTNPVDGRTVVYEDTVEVGFDGVSLLGKGDAGSLMITRTGEVVGLVVAGTPRVCYVAPLAPLLEKQNLKLVAASSAAVHGAYEDFISAHNRQIREKVRTEGAVDLGPMPDQEAA